VFSSHVPQGDSSCSAVELEPSRILSKLTDTAEIKSPQGLINKVACLKYRSNFGDDSSPAKGDICYCEDVVLITSVTRDGDQACFSVRMVREFAGNTRGLIGVGVGRKVLYLSNNEYLIPIEYSSYHVLDSSDWGGTEQLPVYTISDLKTRGGFSGGSGGPIGCAGTIAVAGMCLLGGAFFSKGCEHTTAVQHREHIVSLGSSHPTVLGKNLAE
jgi:hypothetical protein